MKTLLASGLAFAVLTGVALAQAASPAPAGAKAPPPPPAAGMSADPAGMMPPPPPGGPRAGGPGPGAMADGGPDGPRGLRMPPPPPRGAHIHLQRGDLVLDVKCADDEPTKSCGDTALQMLDRIQAMPQGAAQGMVQGTTPVAPPAQ